MSSEFRRRPYERPALTRHPLENLGTGAWAHRPFPVVQDVDGATVEDLLSRFGSPLYVIREGVLRDRVRAFRAAFEARYRPVTVAYSYKTNYLSAVCAVLHQEGAWAEVVSGFEYDIALDLGCPGDRIVYNGPYKDEASLGRALAMGSLVNLDSMTEVLRAETAAQRLGRRVPVGMRVNMAQEEGAWDKFGLNLDNGQALDTARRIGASEGLRLAGLHCHLGTYVSDPGAYGRAAERLARLALDLGAGAERPIEYLDLGGGYASRSTLHGQLLSGAATAPTPGQYAEAIAGALHEVLPETGARPRLILEPGRALVDEAALMLATVLSVREGTPAESGALVLDAGVHVLPTTTWYRMELVPAGVRERMGPPREYSVHGPLPLDADVLRDRVRLPPMVPGDRVAFLDAGAYNISQSLQLVRGRPAVVLVDPAGRAHVIREAEDPRRLAERDRLPAHLDAHAAAHDPEAPPGT
ncbi:MAG: diaminopimelate decarboxylase [Planctomycetes bacterium]|nr:diaminopimelate decarboxylase [Planctomycetota bacterium]